MARKTQSDDMTMAAVPAPGKDGALDLSFPEEIKKTRILAPTEEEKVRELRQRLEPGEVIEVKSKYIIKEAIGGGGIGNVYLAEKEATVADFVNPITISQAIKIISPDSPLLEKKGGYMLLEHLLLTEAGISLKLGGNPYTATVSDIITLKNGSVGLVFELINGRTLRELNNDHIARGQLVPYDIVAFIAHRTASVLIQAHKKGVSHRDLSDGNIMIHESGALKVLDWGNSEGFMGKPGYRAPEDIASPQEVNRRKGGPSKADIFSLGVLLRKLVVGKNVLDPPAQLDEAEAFSYREKLDLDTLLPVHEVCEDVPKEFSDIIGACMRKEANDRPTIKQLYHDLLGPYLYSHGFGFTAETLESYLETFDANPDTELLIPDDDTGINLQRIPKWLLLRAGATQKSVEKKKFKYADIWRSLVDVYGATLVKTALGKIIAEEYTKAISDTESPEERTHLAQQWTTQINSLEQAKPESLKKFLNRDGASVQRLNRMVHDRIMTELSQFRTT